jgi:glycosyltransferase involved in cell wall biosynthesis
MSDVEAHSHKISVVIPCYNEASTIARLISAVHGAPVENLEVIVVDDGSTDGTADLLRGNLHDQVDKVIIHERNQGKGAALRSGISAAAGDIVIIQDADLEYDPQEYPRLVQPILDSKADVVYGSRFFGHEPHRVLFFWHYVGNRFLTLLSNMFTNLNLSDMETGYKVFRREVVQKIKIEENRFGFEPEVTAKIARIPGIRIYEVGISYYGRTYAEGKKINWKDGVRAIFCILKYGFLRSSAKNH